MRKPFVQVLHHDIRFVKDEVPVHQGGEAVVRVEGSQVFRFVIGININRFNRNTFFRKYDSYPMAIMTTPIGIKGHR
jgi:hypothetical protein